MAETVYACAAAVPLAAMLTTIRKTPRYQRTMLPTMRILRAAANTTCRRNVTRRIRSSYRWKTLSLLPTTSRSTTNSSKICRARRHAPVLREKGFFYWKMFTRGKESSRTPETESPDAISNVCNGQWTITAYLRMYRRQDHRRIP